MTRRITKRRGRDLDGVTARSGDTIASLAMCIRVLSEFRRDRRGNIAIMYALSLPVLMFIVGMAIDFGHAAQVRTQLNAAADAAVFAALTPAMMQQSNATAQTAAENMFNGQTAAITSLVANDTTVTVTVTNPNGNALIRNVTVTYSAQNDNMFAGFLGLPTTSVGGTSSATATTAPNINFYLLLDNSPSMALPSTQAGITQLENLTPQQLDGGCAYACHQQKSNDWVTAGNPCAKTSSGTTTYTTPTLDGSYAPGGNTYCAASQGTQIDNYQLARNNNITLQLDVLSSAALLFEQFVDVRRQQHKDYIAPSGSPGLSIRGLFHGHAVERPRHHARRRRRQ